MVGSEKEFVVTEARTHGPGHGTVYRRSEPNVIPFSYSGAQSTKEIVYNLLHSTYLKLYKGHFSRANNEKMTKALK